MLISWWCMSTVLHGSHTEQSSGLIFASTLRPRSMDSSHHALWSLKSALIQQRVRDTLGRRLVDPRASDEDSVPLGFLTHIQYRSIFRRDDASKLKARTAGLVSTRFARFTLRISSYFLAVCCTVYKKLDTLIHCTSLNTCFL